MKDHYSEADLLETYYMQPGESMPVMMHLANCTDCAARYERLERKLRESAACSTDAKPETFWTRQRLAIMRSVEARRTAPHPRADTARIAAAVFLSFLLGGAVVFETYRAKLPAAQAPVASTAAQPVAATSTTDGDATHDAWQADELKDFHQVVEWESWVADKEKPAARGES
jgi:predicted anti-sigma-YlaC factor YlaD